MQLVPRCAHPCEQLGHQLRHPLRRRCHKDATLAIKDAFLAAAKNASLTDQASGHHPVAGTQIIQTVGIDMRQAFIRCKSVLDFLDLFSITQDQLPVDHILHLIQRQRVGFDVQR